VNEEKVEEIKCREKDEQEGKNISKKLRTRRWKRKG
jgi:hypothetical protein